MQLSKATVTGSYTLMRAAKQRFFQRGQADIHVSGHFGQWLADEAHRNAFHCGHVIAQLDQVADRAAAAIAAVSAAAPR
ncbi:hypothetical protein HDG37_004878 [Paraburkholderia sp. MM5384-R2]|nr:hypothetical protein [Paraburkholderia sp. MM5384-R2]